MGPSAAVPEPLSVAAFTAPGQPFELVESVVRAEDSALMVIWDRQQVARPPLCDGDGPIATFRVFFSQFCAEWQGEGGPAADAPRQLGGTSRA